MLLTGKSALITGAGRGIGRAIALAFAQQGCDICIVSRTESELEETTHLASAITESVISCRCDVTQPDQVESMVLKAQHTFGKIDILVNNAGFAEFKPFWEYDFLTWQKILDTNLNSMFHCIQAVLPDMMKRRSGRIINISSVTGLKPIENQSAYCAAKHAVNGLSKSLALELRRYNIAVHAVCPGGVATKMTDDVMPDRDKADFMQPEDIAHAALFLATMSSKMTTDVLTLRRFESTPLG